MLTCLAVVKEHVLTTSADMWVPSWRCNSKSKIRVPVRGNCKGQQIVQLKTGRATLTRIETQTAKNSAENGINEIHAETIEIRKTESRAIKYYNMIFPLSQLGILLQQSHNMQLCKYNYHALTITCRASILCIFMC